MKTTVPKTLRRAPALVMLASILAFALAFQACDDDDDLDGVGEDIERSAEEARRELEAEFDDVREDISDAADGVAVDDIRDIDIENGHAVVTTNLSAERADQARDLCDAAIDNPVLSVDTAQVRGEGGRVLADCRES